MTAYRARFNDGQEISLKNSRREYGFAWRYVGIRGWDGERVSQTGWARTRELAEKAANQESAYFTRRSKWHNARDWKPGQLISIDIVPVEKIEAAR